MTPAAVLVGAGVVVLGTVALCALSFAIGRRVGERKTLERLGGRGRDRARV